MMPWSLLSRTLLVSMVTTVVFLFAQRFTGIYIPWWVQMFMGWPAGRIAIAWYRRRHPWPY